MERQLTRIEDKLDKVADRIGSIDITLASQAVQLEEHIRRTNLLEEKVRPLEAHVSMFHGALKLVGLIGVVGAIIEATVQVVEFLGK